VFWRVGADADVAVKVSEPKKGTRHFELESLALFVSSLKSQGLNTFLKGVIV